MSRTSTLESNPTALQAYDYERQAWLVRATPSSPWAVAPCGHPASMKPGCCYAGSHAGETVAAHEDIH